MPRPPPMIRPSSDVYRVPMICGSTPNFVAFASQTEVYRNDRPYWPIAELAWRITSNKIMAKSARTAYPKNRASQRNARLNCFCQAVGGCEIRVPAFGAAETIDGLLISVRVGRALGRNPHRSLDGVDGLRDLLRHGLGQRHIMQLFGELLAIGQAPREQLLHGVRLRRVVILLLRQD